MKPKLCIFTPFYIFIFSTSARYGSFHYGSCCGCDNVLGSIYNSSTPISDDYHVFAVEWSGSNVTWYAPH